MGRRNHLEVTLPLMLETFDKVIVVDWSCPEKSGDWAATEGASVVYKYGEKYFDRTCAKNLGARQVTTEFVAFIDADGFCFPEMKEDLQSVISQNAMALAARNPHGSDLTDTFGFVACPIETFWKVGGYDESFKGWGHEDSKLRGQLLLEGRLDPVRLQPGSLGAIRHDSSLREKFNPGTIGATAAPNWKKLYSYFSQFGITDWMTDPRTQSITFRPNSVNK
jgi:hypothetical protein